MMTEVVRLEKVRRTFCRGDEVVVAIDDLTLTVDAGEMVALVGPSGCGKSTTLNLVAAVDRPDSGRIVVCGQDLADADERALTRLRRQQVGMIFQAFHLVPNLTVEENIALPLALAGRSDPDRVQELLGRIDLRHRRHHFPSELSGGEQQRTAIARAMVHQPAVVVADEPTGNLDSVTGGKVLGLMDDLRRQEGAGLLLATHDERLARAADRLVRLRDGSRVES
jgi:putative ABC transport system ATP-binding protein